MRKSVKLLAVVIAIAGISVSYVACKKSDEKSGRVLVFARAADSVGLDPAREDDAESLNIADNVYEGLVRFKLGTTEIEPSLAESWEISSDNLVYTFHLKKGVKFHDGTAFNADAVVYSLERQFRKDHPAYKFGPWKYWNGMDMNNIVKEVKKIDDLTVKITLKRKESPFIANLAMQFASIVSPSAAEKYKEDFNSNPVGTGPFKFVKWVKNDSIILDRNEAYWGTKTFLDRVIFKVIPDSNARYRALKKGEIDIFDQPSPEDMLNIKSDASIKTFEQAGLNVGYMALNLKKKPLDNKHVRQAINYAINKEEIIKAVYGTMGTAAVNPIPPIMWSCNTDNKGYVYNLAKAKELMTKSGVKGFELTLYSMPVSRPYCPNGKKMAEIIKSQLKEIGITVKISSFEWGTYLDKIGKGEHDACLIGWTGDNGDPDNFLNYLLSSESADSNPSPNYSFWKNAEFTSLIKQAKETSDINVRTKLYKQAQIIFNEEAPWVAIAHSVVIIPAKMGIKGFFIEPTGKRTFSTTYFDK